MRALAAVAVVAFGFTAIAASPAHTTLRGFTVASSVRERTIESQFVDIPSAQRALEIAATIGARPHYAGTPGDYALAVYMRDTMRAAGIATELESFTTRVDTPRRLVVALASPDDSGTVRRRGKRRDAEFPIALDLAETGEPSDPATSVPAIGLPFNSGSGDGDVRAPLVYVDRGREGDYATLAQANVDVSGAIVLVRYGAEFRGLLAERAQTHGAVGVIFYSDPQDDGATRGAVYPAGPWRPPTAIQRGSVGNTIHIPTLPISAANAQILLAALHGSAGPATWGGGLPVAYPLARGPGRVHLVVKLNRKPALLWNTIGIIPGVHGDQSVVIGAHRDAWVYGVVDNGAGVSTMLEVARGLGFLLKSGWRPQRSIVIAGWDGEEIGLAGSRAYTQAHHAELDRGCAAYLNADENITGQSFGAAAVAAIAPLIIEATHEVPDPLMPAATVYDRWAAQAPRSRPHIESPGGGSDHEPFLYGPGIPVANIGFSGPFGVYHSSYDTLRYATLFSDAQFAFHRTTAQLYGLVTLRLADADVLPYTFGGYIPVLRAGVAQIALRAASRHIDADLTPLRRAVDRLALSTVRSDSLVVQARSDTTSELRAVHGLDALLYGVTGYAGVFFPEIGAALTTSNAPAVTIALHHAVDLVDRATQALTN